MEEIKIKVDIPAEFKKEFSSALSRVMESFTKDLEFSVAKEILSKSKLTEEDAENLSKEVKKSLHERYKSEYPQLE